MVGSLDEALNIRGFRYHPADIEATIVRCHKNIVARLAFTLTTVSCMLEWESRNGTTVSCMLEWEFRNGTTVSCMLEWECRNETTVSCMLEWEFRNGTTVSCMLEWEFRNEL